MGPKKSVPKPADMPTLEFTFDSKEVERVDELKKPDKPDEVIDIYCVNLQRIEYRGKRTFLSSDVETAPGT